MVTVHWFFSFFLPAGDDLAAADQRLFILKRLVDDGTAFRRGIPWFENQGLLQNIDAAADQHFDVGMVPGQAADGIPAAFKSGKRLRKCAGIFVVAVGCDIELNHRRLLAAGPAGHGAEKQDDFFHKLVPLID